MGVAYEKKVFIWNNSVRIIGFLCCKRKNYCLCLYKSVYLDKNKLEILKDFRENDLVYITGFDNKKDLLVYKYGIFNDKYKQVLKVINAGVLSQIKNKEKIADYIKLFEKFSNDKNVQEQLYSVMIKDKKNFKVKRKLVIF